jgi:hypothetical protein
MQTEASQLVFEWAERTVTTIFAEIVLKYSGVAV